MVDNESGRDETNGPDLPEVPADVRRMLFDRNEGRRTQYFAEWSAIATREAAAMSGAQSDGVVFSSMVLRTLIQFNAASLLGVPAVVLSSARPPTGAALDVFVLGLAALFVSMLLASMAALWAHIEFFRGTNAIQAMANIQRNHARLIFDDTPKIRELVAERDKTLSAEREAAWRPVMRANLFAYIFGWSSVVALMLGVIAVGAALVEARWLLGIWTSFRG